LIKNIFGAGRARRKKTLTGERHGLFEHQQRDVVNMFLAVQVPFVHDHPVDRNVQRRGAVPDSRVQVQVAQTRHSPAGRKPPMETANETSSTQQSTQKPLPDGDRCFGYERLRYHLRSHGLFVQIGETVCGGDHVFVRDQRAAARPKQIRIVADRALVSDGRHPRPSA